MRNCYVIVAHILFKNGDERNIENEDFTKKSDAMKIIEQKIKGTPRDDVEYIRYTLLKRTYVLGPDSFGDIDWILEDEKNLGEWKVCR